MFLKIVFRISKIIAERGFEPLTFGLPTNLDLCGLQIFDLKYEPDGH